MARSSILGAERAARQAEGRDGDVLGPSDSSDSGSDAQGAPTLDAADDLGNIGQDLHAGATGDSDAGGTGERGSAVLGENVREAADILPDRLGGGTGGDAPAGLDGIAELAGEDDDAEEGEPPGRPAAGQPSRGGRDRPR